MATTEKILEMTLIKQVNYKLKPFGRFQFDFKDGKRSKRINVMYFGEIDIKSNTTMPLTDDQDKMVVRQMLKYKTDVFVGIGNGYGTDFYTRCGGGWTEIYHKKLQAYRDFLKQNLEDSDDTWEMYVNENEHLYYH